MHYNNVINSKVHIIEITSCFVGKCEATNGLNEFRKKPINNKVEGYKIAMFSIYSAAWTNGKICRKVGHMFRAIGYSIDIGNFHFEHDSMLPRMEVLVVEFLEI